MDRKVLNKNKNVIARVFTLIFFLFFIGIIIRLSYLCMSDKIDGINLKKFASNRNTKKETLYALRGNIYDANSNILAQTINSYTLIAYLDQSRSKGSSKPLHVVDKELTAEKLSTVLDISKEDILNILNKKDVYQVEFGTKAKGLTELQKEAIEKLELPGIDFITTHKRYYPNNTFLSYIIGYTKTREDGTMYGEMGIEKQYNDEMNGINGYVEYEKDLNGYKFPNANEVRKEKVDGKDIYLTIDSNIQMTLEKVVDNASSASNADWMIAVVMDAKTGKILGSATSPTFNPNIKDIDNYLNPLVSYTYEPGSIMKTYSYMATLENNPNVNIDELTCKTGTYEVGDEVIRDWNRTGWGEISYSSGYLQSSNTCASRLAKNYLTKEQLREFYKKLGFGSQTEIDLPSEYKGKVNFKYEIEVLNAAFGQGITTTTVQQLKALSAIANDGVLLTPYVVDKIVNHETGEVIFNAEPKKSEKVVSTNTINKMKDLMYYVVNNEPGLSTGYMYKLDGYDLIGKTSTAQIANPNTGKYYEGKYDYITSFGGMYPKDNPEVILYVLFQRSKDPQVLYDSVKTIVKDTAKYLKLFGKTPEVVKEVTKYEVDNYLNKEKEEIKKTLDEKGAKYILFGDGNVIVDQFPKKGTIINTKQKLFLFTNVNQKIMPDLYNYSKKEAMIVLDILGIKYEMNTENYVQEQSISPGTIINDEIVVLN